MKKKARTSPEAMRRKIQKQFESKQHTVDGYVNVLKKFRKKG